MKYIQQAEYEEKIGEQKLIHLLFPHCALLQIPVIPPARLCECVGANAFRIMRALSRRANHARHQIEKKYSNNIENRILRVFAIGQKAGDIFLNDFEYSNAAKHMQFAIVCRARLSTTRPHATRSGCSASYLP